jgi:hypothetical protein
MKDVTKKKDMSTPISLQAGTVRKWNESNLHRGVLFELKMLGCQTQFNASSWRRDEDPESVL